MTEYEVYKKKVLNEIDSIEAELIAVSDAIHKFAEYGTMEFKSSNLLISKLEERGFEISRPEVEPGMEPWKDGLRTAIKATYRGKSERPLVGINAEYDAMPIGHGCGHNIIATAALGASLGLSTVMSNLKGTLVFLGSPAEERFMDNAGGKVIMLGEYRKLDACAYVHPGTKWQMKVNPAYDKYGMYADVWKFTFKGSSGHMSQAMAIADAQRAALLTTVAIDTLHIVPPVEHILTGRGLVDFKDHEPYYFNKLGLTEIAELGVYVRQGSKEDLEKALEQVKNCARGAALATNTTVEFHKYAPTYESDLTNVPLAEAFRECFVELNVQMEEAEPQISPGTSDFGNVSRVTPGTYAAIRIGEGFTGHSPGFAKAAASPEAHKAAIIGAKAIALLGVKLFTDAKLVRRAKEDFNRRNLRSNL